MKNLCTSFSLRKLYHLRFQKRFKDQLKSFHYIFHLQCSSKLRHGWDKHLSVELFSVNSEPQIISWKIVMCLIVNSFFHHLWVIPCQIIQVMTPLTSHIFFKLLPLMGITKILKILKISSSNSFWFQWYDIYKIWSKLLFGSKIPHFQFTFSSKPCDPVKFVSWKFVQILFLDKKPTKKKKTLRRHKNQHVKRYLML